MIDNRMIDSQLQKRNEELNIACLTTLKEKTSIVVDGKIKIIEEFIKNMANSDSITDIVNEGWSKYLLGKICAEYIFKNPNIDYYEFLKWFSDNTGFESSIGFIKTIEEIIFTEKNLNKYLSIISSLPSIVNDNMLEQEYVWDRYKTHFKQTLAKWDKNTKALNIIEQRDYAEDDCWHSGIIYYALFPLRNYDKIGLILEEFQYIHPIQNFLNFNEVKANIDILFSILESSPITINESNTWNKNKVALLTLKTIIYYFERLFQILDYNQDLFESEINSILQNLISIIENRKDSIFLLENLMLYLTTQLRSRDIKQQRFGTIAMWEIAKRLNKRIALEEKLLENLNNYEGIRVLLALILLAPEHNFPDGYRKILSDYLCNENNDIFTGGYSEDPIQHEHRILSQLFYSIEKPAMKWKNLWDKLYLERRKKYFLHFNGGYHNIDHSIYLILVGLAACEYFFSEDTKIAKLFLNTIWDSLFEIYLDLPIESQKDLIISSMSRVLIFKARLGDKIDEYIESVQNNSEIIIGIITLLIDNNVDVEFIKSNSNIIEKLKFALDRKRKNKHFDNYYKEIENIIN